MEREDVLATLRAHESELRAAGILHLRLHGSVARGDATAASDVDLIADMDDSKRLSLLDMVELETGCPTCSGLTWTSPLPMC